MGATLAPFGVPPAAATTTGTSTNPSTTSTPAAPTSTTLGAGTGDRLNQFSQLFEQLMSGNQPGGGLGGAAGAPQQPALAPEQRYQIQLEQLANMGFHDRSANIQGKFKHICFFISNSK